MDKENIKIGNIWIEDSESFRKRYFLLSSIFVSILIISAINTCLLMITGIIYTVIFICIVNNIHLPPSSNHNMIAIHYRTNVNFSKDMCWYPDIFDLMKECYKNENLNKKSQKYKIKDIIYLYDSEAKEAKKWFKEQNKENKENKIII